MLRKVIIYFGRNIVKNRNRTIFSSATKFGIYEPDYLDSLQSKYPQYKCLNIQIKGFDFPILENYQKFLHNVAEYLDLDVSESYPLPPQKTLVQRFKPKSSVVEAEYNLTTYERNIQITNFDAPVYPLLLRIAQAALPEGVTLNVFENTADFEEKRYVPDKDLLELKAQLEGMHGGATPRKK